MTPRRQRGFTLIEVLLATSLLAAALALAFATVRAAAAAKERGEAMAARNERIRAVEGFLRQRIGAAEGIVYLLDSDGRSHRFEGTSDSIRFVADLPDYLGRGGPHLHDIHMGEAGDGAALLVDFRMVQAGEEVDMPQARPPEPLAEGLASLQFSYRTLDMQGVPSEWREQWDFVEGLPSHVRVQAADAQGPWPDLVVAVPRSFQYRVPAEKLE